MRIAIIGGRDKNQVDLLQIAHAAGYELEFHDGYSSGRGSLIIRNVVARADLVVVITEINSHSGVFIAKREAQRFKKPTMVIRSFSSARLRGLIAALDRRRDSALLDQMDLFGRDQSLVQTRPSGRNPYAHETLARVGGVKGR
jgi:hypothetical protein